MRIAICDLDSEFLSKVKHCIYRYSSAWRLDIVADCFFSGESVLKNANDYAIIFLGYHLSGINGFETAVRLRQNNVSAIIIFISDYTDFVFDAFKVDAFRFLLKSSFEQELYALLDELCLKPKNGYPILLKSEDETVCVHPQEIRFLEANNKHCSIHLDSLTLNCKRTMASVVRVLPQNTFSKANRSYVVNLRYVSRFGNGTIALKNGDTLRLSRNYSKSFKEEYHRFLQLYKV